LSLLIEDDEGVPRHPAYAEGRHWGRRRTLQVMMVDDTSSQTDIRLRLVGGGRAELWGRGGATDLGTLLRS
jgi:hypothetical protein